MKNKRNLLYGLLIAFPIAIVFRAFFSESSLVWGDAPFFAERGFGDLLLEPSTWNYRSGFLGSVNNLLWISPIMFLYGFLGKLLSMGNNEIIRILFYYPSLFLSVTGSFLFAKHLKLNAKASFFASFIYTFNTYYLLLIDGGQVGVALAYGLFPLALLALDKFSFFKTLIVLSALMVADPRILAVAVLTYFIWQRKIDKKIIMLLVAMVGLASYWLIPLLKISSQSLPAPITDLQQLGILNGLALFQPHWPNNVFGATSSVQPLFYLVPILILLGVIKSKNKKQSYVFVFIILLFSLLLADSSFLLKLPFGVAFRDSSKFFIPIILFSGILIGKGISSAKNNLFSALIYLLLLVLIFPAISGKLNFVLSDRKHPTDISEINKQLENNFTRTSWFPERYPTAFHSENSPAIDAKSLANFRPLARLNVGTDRFNFIYNSQFLDWYQLLGINTSIFSGDPRALLLSDARLQEWVNLQDYVATSSGLIKSDLGTDTPVYKTENTKPRMFSVNKLIGVIGSDDIYDEIKAANPDKSLSDYGFAFFEDGKFDPYVLEGTASNSAVLVLESDDKTDLTLSFLQDYFVSVQDSSYSEWANYAGEDYLNIKYQLLIREFDYESFDYGLGIAFSDQKDEKLVFKLEGISNSVIAMRIMTTEDSKAEISLNGELQEFTNTPNKFQWVILENTLDINILEIKNVDGLTILNTVALIPREEWEEAINLAETFTTHFEAITKEELLARLDEFTWSEVESEKVSNTMYDISQAENNYWVVFADSFHPMWKLKRGIDFFDSAALYSGLNGFYVEPGWRDTKIIFEGQGYFRWGIYFSALSILTTAIIYLWTASKD